MLVVLLVINVVLLVIIMGLIIFGSCCLGFNKEDEIIIVFCGFKKSLVLGVFMVKVLFFSGVIGMVLLLVMLFY